MPTKQKQLLELGRRIRERRHDLGPSQEAFAAACGLHRTYVGSVERGERDITILNRALIAAAPTTEELKKALLGGS